MVSPVSMQLAVLVACVSLARCEWVEISQHYHRPRKPTHYANTSNGEHGWGQFQIPDNWHQTPNKYDTGDEIERWSRKPDDIDRKPTSHNPEENKKITVGPKNAGEDYDIVKKNGDPIAFVKDSPGPTKAIIEKVSNVGSVKRVHLSNTPIKSPTIKISNVSDRKSDNTPVINQESDEFVINANIFKDSYEEVMYTDKMKENNKGRPNTNVHLTNPDNSQTYSNISKGTEPNLDHILNRRVDTEVENIKLTSNITETSNSRNKKVKNERNEVLTTDKVKNNINKSNKHYLNLNDYQFPIEGNQDFKYPDDKSSIQNDQSNEFKVNTMENILKFMKVVTETISKNVRRGVNGKVKYLSELRDSMLQNIKYRIDTCWPDDDVPTSQRERQRGRHSRAAADTSRGHVEFPSSDSALMTISFLTFAVFLIKLVLQVIQAYKNKTMVMAPVMVATAGRRLLARKEGKH